MLTALADIIVSLNTTTAQQLAIGGWHEAVLGNEGGGEPRQWAPGDVVLTQPLQASNPTEGDSLLLYWSDDLEISGMI